MEELSDIELKERLSKSYKEGNLCEFIKIVTILINRERNCMEGEIELLKIENDFLKKENEKLKNHILSSPDGKLYFEAKEHYERFY